MPVLAFVLHDPKDVESQFLRKITPFLKQHFTCVYIRFTHETVQANKKSVEWFKCDGFFRTSECPENSPIGEHFVDIYKEVTMYSSSEEIVHLCTPDRLAYAVEFYPTELAHDLESANNLDVPLLFTRSKIAWATHPKTYYALESALSKEGEVLFGKFFDFSWCHFVVKLKDLTQVIPHLSIQDYTFMAEMIVFFRDKLIMQEVDWLSWEDPYIYSRNADELRNEREHSTDETAKRLSYVVPIMGFLARYYKNTSNSVK